MGLVLFLVLLALGAWILIPVLLFAFPLPSNWLHARAIKPQQGEPEHLDGVPLQWYPALDGGKAGSRALLIVHGRSRSRGFMEPLALALRQDFNVLTMDLRHHGERGYGSVSYGLKESQDIHTALKFLKKEGFSQIGIIGISMGAPATAKALSEIAHPEVKAFALVGPLASARLVVKQFSPRFLLPPVFEDLILLLGSLLCGANLSDVSTATWLERLRIPLGLFTGDHDQVLGQLHSDSLKRMISFDRVEAYAGGHDEPGNHAMQALLHDWFSGKL